MRRAIRALVCAVVLSVALSSPAVAQTRNGQLAVVLDGYLYSVNEDGSGARALPVPEGSTISELAFSPDGNRLAVVRRERIAVLDLRTGKLVTVADGANPAWSADGNKVLYRRGRDVFEVSALGGPPAAKLQLPEATTAAGLDAREQWAAVLPAQLQLPDWTIRATVLDAPAWSPDGSAVAYAAGGRLWVADTDSRTTAAVNDVEARRPRWSPDGTKLIYANGTALLAQPLHGAPSAVIRAEQQLGPADWQPCVAATVGCTSVAPVVVPRCTRLAESVTMQSGQTAELPPLPCSDPAGRPASPVVVQAPAHGRLSDPAASPLLYTPEPGFSGTDTIVFRLSAGGSESESVTYSVHVVAPPVPVLSTRGPVLVTGAPFLSARSTPRLDRRRRAVVQVYCDQDCSLSVRLTGRLRGRKRSFTGPVVRRKAVVAQRILSLRLKLPAKPRGKLRTVWITGSVRNAAGDMRKVRLPVRLPR